MKKALLIVAIVIVVVGGAFGAYFYFFAKAPKISIGPSNETTLPFAGNTSNTGQGETPAQQPPPADTPPTTQVGDKLVQITTGPVVPGFVLTERAGTSTTSPRQIFLSYIERQSGNVYTYSFTGGTVTRTSNRTVPGIQSATWLPDASLAYVQYLSGATFDTVNTYALPALGAGGFFLPQNLAGLAVSSTSILTLVSGVNGSILSLAKTDGSKATEVLSTPLSSVIASYAGKGYMITTRASGTLPGAAYVTDTGGALRKIAGPLPGLATKVSPRGDWALMSYIADGAIRLDLVRIATGERIALPIATLVEKCVWAQNDASIFCGVPVEPPRDQNYPDDWYQAGVAFSDRIWRIDVTGRYAQLVLDISREADAPVDAVALALDPKQSTLVFMNRNDGSLWGYRL